MNIGIKVNVREMDWPTYLAAVRGKSLPIFFLGWAPDYADPDDYILPFLRTGQTYSGRINYSNPEVDTLIDKAAQLQNNATRAALYKQIEEKGAQDYPYIYISQGKNFFAIKNWIQGFEDSGSTNPMASGRYIQYINKEPHDLYTYSHASQPTTSGSAGTNASPSFEFITALFAIIPTAIIARRRFKN